MIQPRVRSVIAYVTLAFAGGAIIPYLPLFYGRLGFTLGEVGGVLALGALVGLAMAPVWGALSDRHRGSPYVLVGAIATALVGATTLALVSDHLIVIAGGAVMSAGMSGVVPILDARAVENAGPIRGGYGPLRAWGSAAYTVAALVIGVAIDRAGIGAMFAILIVALVATGTVGLTLRPAARSAMGSATRPLLEAGRLFGPRGLGLFMLGAFLTWLGMSSVLTFTPLRFAELGADAATVGLGGAIAAGLEVPFMLRFPQLAARFGSERLLVVGAGFIAARAVVAAAATAPGMLLAASVFGGIGFALFFVGGVTYVSQHVPREFAATAQGIFQGIGSSLSNVVSALLGGSIAAVASLQGLFALAACLGVAAVIIIGFAVLRRRSASTDAALGEG